MPPRPGQTSPAAPIPGRRNILITSALPYVNDVPHLGNIIGSALSADVFARYSRARGLQTLFIGGTDEYGTATEIRAAKEGWTPQKLCEQFHKIHAEIYQWFNISFDKFGRTTTQSQTDIAQQIFSKVHENGFLDERVTSRLFCESDRRFLADRYVVGDCPRCGKEARGDECDNCGSFDDAIELKNPRCNLGGCGRAPVTRDTRHLFFRLDRLEQQVKEFFDDSAEKGRWSSPGKGQTVAWFKRGLKERSITRDIKFGTPVPPHLLGYEDKVIYNWFDAPIGYMSITAEHTDRWRDWWQPQNPKDVQLYQFIGKDNVFFHSIFFPATQIATGDNWTKVHHLSTTEYLQYEGSKFSKSKGIGVFGDQAKNSGIKADVWRFYLLYNRPEHGDTEFKWNSFIEQTNRLLNEKLGNLVNRVIKFVNKPAPSGYGGIVPGAAPLHDEDKALKKQKEECINNFLSSYLGHLDAVELRDGLSTILKISDVGNKLAHDASLVHKDDKERCGALLHICLNIIHLLAALLQPFLPDTAESIARQLGVEPVSVIPDNFDCDSIRPGHRLDKAVNLFTKIDSKLAEDLKAQCGGSAPKEVTSAEAGNTKKGKKSKKGHANSGVSKREGGGDAKKPRDAQEEQPKTRASGFDGSAAVDESLAQETRSLSFK